MDRKKQHLPRRIRRSLQLASIGAARASICALTWLAACGLAQAQAEPAAVDTEVAPGEAPELPQSSLIKPEPESSPVKKPRAARLPAVTLTPEILYKLIMAEIAVQRDTPEPGLVTYLELAQRTRDPRLAQRAAEIALSSGDLALAFDAVKLWNTLAPASELAKQAQLALSATLGRDDVMLPYLRQRLRSRAPQAESIALAARTLARLPDKAQALRLLDDLLKDLPASPERHLALAQAAASAGDAARAYREARVAAALSPDNELIALAAFQIGQLVTAQTALADLNAFVRTHPRAGAPLLALARAHVQRHDYASAQRLLENYLSLPAASSKPGASAPASSSTTPVTADTLQALEPQALRLDALFLLAWSYYQAGDLDAVQTTLQRYLSAYEQLDRSTAIPLRDPDVAYLLMAQVFEDKGQPNEAIRWLDRVDEGEQHLLAQLRKAQLLARQKQLDAAQAVLAALTPQSEAERSQILLARGQVLREAGDSAGAYQFLTEATQAAPDQPEVIYERAMLAEQLGKLDDMERLLKHLIELQPQNAHAYNALGYALADRHQRLPEARALIEKALALAPDDAAIQDSMGWVAFRQGKLDEALDYLRRAAKGRNDVEILVHLGEVLWTAGKTEEAREQFDLARQRDPQNALLRSTLERLKVPD